MDELRVRHILEPKTNRVPVMDRPRPRAEGGIEKRFIAKGDPQKAYYIEYYDGVPYARIVPKNPNDKEYIRVREAGENGFEWCGVIDVDPPADIALANAVVALADALRAAGKDIAHAMEKAHDG